MRSEDYIKIAIENIVADRKKLERLYADLEDLKNPEDPARIQVIGDNLVKVADSLTKQTGQIVELAKLKSKIDAKESGEEGLSDDDHEEIYNAISGVPMTKSSIEDVDV